MPDEEKLVSHYRLKTLLRKDGFGAVYFAEDTRDQKACVLRVIELDQPTLTRITGRVRARSQRDHPLVEQIRQRVKRISELKNSHILPVIEFGEEHIQGNNDIIFYMVSPYEKASLLSYWSEHTSSAELISLEIVSELLFQAAEGLFYAHRRGLVHQYVRLSSFMLHETARSRKLHLYLTDFWFADISAALLEEGQISQDLSVYLASEQLAGHAVAASDQYALAILAYELLLGYRLSQVDLSIGIYERFMRLRGGEVSEADLQLAHRLDLVLARALAEDVSARYNNIEEFALAFRAVASGELIELEEDTAKLPLIARSDLRSGQNGVEIAAIAAGTLVAGEIAGEMTEEQTRSSSAATGAASFIAGLAAGEMLQRATDISEEKTEVRESSVAVSAAGEAGQREIDSAEEKTEIREDKNTGLAAGIAAALEVGEFLVSGLVGTEIAGAAGLANSGLLASNFGETQSAIVGGTAATSLAATSANAGGFANNGRTGTIGAGQSGIYTGENATGEATQTDSREVAGAALVAGAAGLAGAGLVGGETTQAAGGASGLAGGGAAGSETTQAAGAAGMGLAAAGAKGGVVGAGGVGLAAAGVAGLAGAGLAAEGAKGGAASIGSAGLAAEGAKGGAASVGGAGLAAEGAKGGAASVGAAELAAEGAKGGAGLAGAGLAVGGVAGGTTQAIGGGSIGGGAFARPTRGRRRRTLLAAIIIALLLLLLFGSISAYALGQSSSATVTLTLASHTIQSTYLVTATTNTNTGTTNTTTSTSGQVQANFLKQSASLSQSGQVSGYYPGAEASGFIKLSNSSTGCGCPVFIPAGTSFVSGSGVTVVLDYGVSVASLCSVTVPAHAMIYGPGGDISAGNVHAAYSSHIWATNPYAFTGGQGGQSNALVQQSDIDHLAGSLRTQVVQSAETNIQAQVKSNQRLFAQPNCQTRVKADHAAGDSASSVTVNVIAVCSAEAYDYNSAIQIVRQQVQSEASSYSSDQYTLTSGLQTTVASATVTDAKAGTVLLAIKVFGKWIHKLSSGLEHYIANRSVSEARTILTQFGAAHVDISISGFNANTLPSDSSKIKIVVNG